ncbi:CBS domain-containing protein [Ornithinimicrobium cerasi]|uniref:CBS domain-containing protein n=1 Tax=Ornithinimicrobium cerasi TaxID=2248773 RepID=A0A285VRS7_9MICO|nr:CBS domain-containing protein [Ornithinimicrobium cerasi]SOC55321.1 CBS domain-containing protein [Ornithinimicrobium cerasi]
MTTAREIMTAQMHTVTEDQSLVEAAALMRDHGVGALPVLGSDGGLVGIVTDRDIVVRGVADGADLASMTVGGVAHGIVSTVAPDEDVDRVLDTMGDQQIKRLPVVEEGRLVGMISESDLARHVADDKVAHFVQMVYGRG